jgi:hypothetical protein
MAKLSGEEVKIGSKVAQRRGMKTLAEHERRIKEIEKELRGIGPMLPGGISEQWYTCKKKGCKCMDKNDPHKHGPYHQLSYSVSGKSSTMIIKADDLEKARMCLDNNRRFKELNLELLKANIASLKANGFKGLKVK